MSDEVETADAPQSAAEDKLPPDWLLAQFVDMASEGGISIGVTLVVGGSLVSGTIISGRTYLTLLGEQIQGTMGQDQSGEKKPLFGAYIDAIYPAETDDEQAEGSKRFPTFIHLKDVRVFHGSVHVPQRFENILWRGRLSSVDGFILGELRQEQGVS